MTIGELRELRDNLQWLESRWRVREIDPEGVGSSEIDLRIIRAILNTVKKEIDAKG
jgi:hypothetical protein